MPFREITTLSSYTKLGSLLGILLLLFVVFSAGVSLGRMNQSNPHGVIGSVNHINLPRFSVRGPHRPEVMVMIGSSTALRRLRTPVGPEDLRVGQQVVVLGSPDSEGTLSATFIRILPPKP
ncbi:MAG: hypothetical protein WCV79_03075 [Candidatus Paceibacterota bacterium]